MVLRGKNLPFFQMLPDNKNIIQISRGVSDVGFPIFADADTDADFAF